MAPTIDTWRPFPPRRGTSRGIGAWIGLSVAVVLMGVAMVIPKLFGWDVHVRYFPPLHAEWDPRVGVGTIPAIVVGCGWDGLRHSRCRSV